MSPIPAEASSLQTQQPSNMTPQFCLNTTALRDFLRLSRATVDDSISANLNALIHPASGGFRPATLPGPRSRRNVPDAACSQFKYTILFPSWRARDSVLTYCSQVAEVSESHNFDGESLEAENTTKNSIRGTGPRMNTNYWGQPTVVDERTDPYSARDYSYARETQTQTLRNVLINERNVERIVRQRTWALLSERCEGGASDRSDGDGTVTGGEQHDSERDYRNTFQ